MATYTAPSFRQARENLISLGPWLLLFRDREEALSNEITWWDPATSLRLRRLATVDDHQIRNDCGLTRDEPIKIAIIWRATPTETRGPASAIKKEDRHTPVDVALELELPGELLGG